MPAASGLSLQRGVIHFDIDISQKGRQTSEKTRLDHYDFHVEVRTMHDGNKVGLNLVCTFQKYKTATPAELEKQNCSVFVEGMIANPAPGNDYKFERYLTFPETLKQDKRANLDTLSIEDVKNLTKAGIYTLELQIRFVSMERPSTACLDSHNLERPWDGSDIIFQVDGKEVHCHGKVISQCKKLAVKVDEYNVEMKKRQQQMEDEESTDDELSALDVQRKLAKPIVITGTKHTHFVKLVKLFYPAIFNQDLDEATIFELADTLLEYDVFLKKAGRRLVDTIDKTTAVRCLIMSYKLQYHPLKEKALDVITKMKPKEIRKDPYLQRLDHEAMMELEEARVFEQEEKKGDRKIPVMEKEKTKIDRSATRTPAAATAGVNVRKGGAAKGRGK